MAGFSYTYSDYLRNCDWMKLATFVFTSLICHFTYASVESDLEKYLDLAQQKQLGIENGFIEEISIFNNKHEMVYNGRTPKNDNELDLLIEKHC